MHSEHSDGLQNTDITILQLISEFGALQGPAKDVSSTDPSARSKCSHTNLPME